MPLLHYGGFVRSDERVDQLRFCQNQTCRQFDAPGTIGKCIVLGVEIEVNELIVPLAKIHNKCYLKISGKTVPLYYSVLELERQRSLVERWGDVYCDFARHYRT